MTKHLFTSVSFYVAWTTVFSRLSTNVVLWRKIFLCLYIESVKVCLTTSFDFFFMESIIKYRVLPQAGCHQHGATADNIFLQNHFKTSFQRCRFYVVEVKRYWVSFCSKVIVRKKIPFFITEIYLADSHLGILFGSQLLQI